MKNSLKVIEPFFNLNVGDVLELNKAGDSYVISCEESYDGHDENTSNTAKFASSLTLSKSYAAELIREGYLEEVVGDNANFRNVFDEIDQLIEKYTAKLNEVETKSGEHPLVVHESRTVYNNLLTVLTHLKSLKK